MSSGHTPPPVSSPALPRRGVACRSAVDPHIAGEFRSAGVAAAQETVRNNSSLSGAEPNSGRGGEGGTPMDTSQTTCGIEPAQAERQIHTPAERLISCQCLQSGQYCEECSQISSRRKNSSTAENEESLRNEHDGAKGKDSNNGPIPVLPPSKRARVDEPSTAAIQGSCSQTHVPDQTQDPSIPSSQNFDYTQLRQDIEDTRIRARTLVASKLGTGVLENLCRNLAMLRGGDCGASVRDGTEASNPAEPTDPNKEQKRRREGAIINHLATFVDDVVGDLKRQLPTLSQMELLHQHRQQQSHSQLRAPTARLPPPPPPPPVPSYSAPHRANIPAVYNQSIGGVSYEMVQALGGHTPGVSIGGDSMLSNSQAQSDGSTHVAAPPWVSYSVDPQNMQPPQPSTNAPTGSLPKFQGASAHPSTMGGMRPIQLLPPRTSKLGQLNNASLVTPPFPHPAPAVATSIHPTGILPTQTPSLDVRRNAEVEGFNPAISHRAGVSRVLVPPSSLPGQGLISNGYVAVASPQTNSHGGEPSQPKDPRLGVIRSEGGDSIGIPFEEKQHGNNKQQQIGQTLEQNSRLKYLQN
ncbi:hypothetical protein BSKO_01155 [Bryopsis sp. KO-2023]|nr:hypothetical protein BSKO_01155 [Bryopsis sp. KO-2023]